MHKTLFLTLRKKPFEVMISGEKNIEFRTPSDWIKSRLFNKDGSLKEYDAVKFVNGYGKYKPSFTAIFNGFNQSHSNDCKTYSNGLQVIIRKFDFQIFIGDIIKKENINAK